MWDEKNHKHYINDADNFLSQKIRRIRFRPASFLFFVFVVQKKVKRNFCAENFEICAFRNVSTKNYFIWTNLWRSRSLWESKWEFSDIFVEQKLWDLCLIVQLSFSDSHKLLGFFQSQVTLLRRFVTLSIIEEICSIFFCISIIIITLTIKLTSFTRFCAKIIKDVSFHFNCKFVWNLISHVTDESHIFPNWIGNCSGKLFTIFFAIKMEENGALYSQYWYIVLSGLV